MNAPGPRGKVVVINPETCYLVVSDAINLAPNAHELPPEMVRAFDNLVREMRGSARLESAGWVDMLFVLCIVADPEHLPPSLIVHMFYMLSPDPVVFPIEWLVAVCEVDAQTFYGLHARCFAARLLARLLTGLGRLGDIQLPPWCADDQRVISLIKRLIAVGGAALDTLDDPGNFHDAVLRAGRPDDVWFAVACPGSSAWFKLSRDALVERVDALLASVANEIVLAVIGLALALAWRERLNDALLDCVRGLAADELPALLARLRAYALRPGLTYGPLHQSFSLVTELQALVSFSEPRTAACRFEEAWEFLTEESGTQRALRNARETLSSTDAPPPAGAQQVHAPQLQSAGPAAAGAAQTAQLVLSPGGAAASLVPELALRDAQAFPLPCAQAPDEDASKFAVYEQAHARAHPRGELPLASRELTADFARAVRAALRAESSPAACRTWAEKCDRGMRVAYDPASALRAVQGLLAGGEVAGAFAAGAPAAV